MLLNPVSLVLIAVLSFIISYAVKQRRSKLPPGPWGVPILGYLPFLDAKAPYSTLSGLVGRYGKVFSVQLGQVTCVVLSDPQWIRKCFMKQEFSGRAPLFLTHGIMGGFGLICAEGKMWKIHRKMTLDFLRRFGMMAKKNFEVTKMQIKILDCVGTFIKGLKQTTNIDLTSEELESNMSHTLGNMLNQIIFGIQYEETDPRWLRLQMLRKDGIKELAVAGPVNFLPWVRHLWPKINETMKWIVEGKLESHREYARISDKVEFELSDSHATDEEVHTFTRAFIEERNRLNKIDSENAILFSHEQLHHVQGDLFGAGMDTTLTTLKWILVSLATFQDVQEKIHTEIENVAESVENGNVCYEDLPFTQAVILEVQRLFPVVPLGVPHGTTDWVTLGDEVYRLPPNTMVMVLHWHMNRDPDLWSDPETFKPERFLNEVQDSIVIPSHFMPFQVGRRRCVGEDFGKLILFTFVSKLLQKFRIQFSKQSSNYDLHQVHDHGFTYSPKPFELTLTRKSITN